MAKNENTGQYGEVVSRLQGIVEALEAGELSLEDSLERFGEGIRLVKEGEKLLADAEKRIEQLLSDDGKTQPLKVPEATASATASLATPMATKAVKRAPAAVPTSPPADELDDVPF